MRNSYAIWHWVLTILISPFTICIFQNIVMRKSIDASFLLLGLYPYLILFGFAFSIPTLLIYLCCFYFLARSNIPVLLFKLMLIAVAVVGIIITISVVLEQMDLDSILPYSITALIVGLVLKSGTKKVSGQAPVS